MKARPKTGEKRVVRQPLGIDQLPEEARAAIQQRRAEGCTWMEIEEASQKFVAWKELPAKVAALFPHRRLPHSNLQRWYDLRVEQVNREMMEKAGRARELAGAFASRGFKDLPDAVRNALGDLVFSLMESGSSADQGRLRKELMELGWLLNDYKKTEIKQGVLAVQKKRVDLLERNFDKATNEAAGKLEKGRALTIDDINKIRERTFGLPPIERRAARGPAA